MYTYYLLFSKIKNKNTVSIQVTLDIKKNYLIKAVLMWYVYKKGISNITKLKPFIAMFVSIRYTIILVYNKLQSIQQIYITSFQN